MGYGRAVLWGVVAAIVVIVVAVAGLAVVKTGGRSPMAVPGDRLMVVVASTASDGSQVAELIAIVDASSDPLRVALVDPLATVTVPGTSSDRLSDAYAFGGGAAVSQAYARSRNVAALPVVAVTRDGLVAVVDRSGGVTVDVPAATDAFDGTRLFRFRAGPQRLDGAAVAALLSSMDFAKNSAEIGLLSSRIASGALDALATDSRDLGDLLSNGEVTSTISRRDLLPLVGKLRARLRGSLVTTLAL